MTTSERGESPLVTVSGERPMGECGVYTAHKEAGPDDFPDDIRVIG